MPGRVGQYARMRRTTISLPDDLAAALDREARRRRVPVSQVAREAIEAWLGLSDESPREIPFIGAAESHDSTWSAADLDEFLAQTWADEIYRDAFNRDP
jgi:predicted transcriptional regulator